jgi:hypothetical protein
MWSAPTLDDTFQAPRNAHITSKAPRLNTPQELSNAPPPKASNTPTLPPNPCVPQFHIIYMITPQLENPQVKYKPP